jgi:hypothetical protein
MAENSTMLKGRGRYDGKASYDNRQGILWHFYCPPFYLEPLYFYTNVAVSQGNFARNFHFPNRPMRTPEKPQMAVVRLKNASRDLPQNFVAKRDLVNRI